MEYNHNICIIRLNDKMLLLEISDYYIHVLINHSSYCFYIFKKIQYNIFLLRQSNTNILFN